MTSNAQPRNCAPSSHHHPHPPQALSIITTPGGPNSNIDTAVPTRASPPAPTTTANNTIPSPHLQRVAADGVLESAADYTVLADGPRHAGLWSVVRFAYPAPAAPVLDEGVGVAAATATAAAEAAYTPPATPVKWDGALSSCSTATGSASFGGSASFSGSASSAPSAIWAIKTPLNASARAALRSEARTLTRLTLTPGAAARIVPFLGLDPASGSVLMAALPLSLEDLIAGDLAQLRPARRTKVLARLFPRLADRLLKGLEWLHERAGVVHADVKPANVLLRPREGRTLRRWVGWRVGECGEEREGEEGGEGKKSRRFSLFAAGAEGADGDDDGFPDLHPLYTDFTASFALRPSPPNLNLNTTTTTTTTNTNTPTPPTSPLTPSSTTPLPLTTPSFALPLGGGTWDFLAPELCRLSPAPTPTPASDVYALGISLLVLILGVSPFEAVAGRNVFRRREMVRVGDAVGFAAGSGRELRGLGEVLGRDLGAGKWCLEGWLRHGLRKRAEERAGAGVWARELREGLGLLDEEEGCEEVVV